VQCGLVISGIWQVTRGIMNLISLHFGHLGEVVNIAFCLSN
jgi:hypothetical protein